jgi:hypothetical protein
MKYGSPFLNLGLIVHVGKVLIEMAGLRLMQEFSAFHKTQKFEKKNHY